MKHFNKIKKTAIWMMIILNLTIAGGYVYLMNQTVFNVAASTEAEKSLVQTLATVTDLESRQTTLKNKVTLDFAYAQGFHDASGQQIFIAKKPVAGTLSFNAL